jgi:AAA family ATP:ADP antiporter
MRMPKLSGVFWFAPATVFLIVSTEVARGPSITLFQKAYGSEHLALMMAVTPIILWAAIYLYGWILSRLGPRKTLLTMSLLYVAILVACYGGVEWGSRMATGWLYLFRTAMTVLLIEQYWSFIDSRLSVLGAKKWNGFLAGMGGIGGVLGSVCLRFYAKTLGTNMLVLVSAMVLLPAIIMADVGYRVSGEYAERDRGQTDSGAGYMGLGEFKRNKLLVLIFLIVMASQALAAVLDIYFQNQVQVAVPNLDERTAYFGTFYAWLNLAALFFQFAVCPLLLKLVPIGLIHLAIPLVHAGMAVALLVRPSLGTSSGAFLVFKSLDYSVFRAAKEMLYIPFSFDTRYRAKEVIDIFGYRLGKGVVSMFVWLMQMAGAAGAMLYPLIAIFSSVLWATFALPAASRVRAEKAEIGA